MSAVGQNHWSSKSVVVVAELHKKLLTLVLLNEVILKEKHMSQVHCGLSAKTAHK